MKTTAQQLLEARNPGKDIREIIQDAMGSRKGQKYIVSRSAMDMDISPYTLYNWCKELDISIEDYRRPTIGSDHHSKAGAEQ